MRRNIAYATAVLLLVALAAGCDPDSPAGVHKENQPPEVWLAIGPPEGSVTDYRVHLYWGAWDPDGEISHFEWTLTDNTTGVFDPADTTGADKWSRTFASDSMFVVAADQVADSSALDNGYIHEFRRSHTFFVRAVDNNGRCSREPVYRSFTSSTISPEIYISTPRRTGVAPATMPPIITFEWIARDMDSEKEEPDSVRWILLNTLPFEDGWYAARDYIRDNPGAPEWSRWHYYDSRADSGRSWTSDPLAFGDYVFAAQAKDEAGAVTPVFDLAQNLRRVFVTDISSGPVVQVSYTYMKDILATTADAPPTILEVPSGLPIGFSWSGDASSYGGMVMGYRYGWDILDLGDPEQWEVSLTPFVGDRATSPTRTFFFGTHTFFLEVLDNNNLLTRVTIVVNVVPFTMERSLLIVDDWKEASGGFRITMGMLPSDEEHDAFWLDVASNVADFGPADLFNIEGRAEYVPVHIITKYKTVIWNAMGASTSTTASVLNDYIEFPQKTPRPGTVQLPNIIEMFMAMGGKVLFAGQNIMTTVLNEGRFRPITYPVIFRYELYGNQTGVNLGTGGANSVAYKDCCLNVIDIAFIQNPNGQRRSPIACPVNRIRDRDRRTDGLRACVPIDTRFPRMTLRPEVAGQTFFWYHESRRGLNCDIYNPPYFSTICNSLAETSPPRDCFEPIWGHECLNTSSAIFGAPVAFFSSRHAGRIPPAGEPGRSVVWGFEPVFFNPDQVKQALDVIFFDEWNLPRGN